MTHTLDVTPWLEGKVDAVLAHRCEVERGALPGAVATMAPDDLARFLGTEYYTERAVARAGDSASSCLLT